MTPRLLMSIQETLQLPHPNNTALAKAKGHVGEGWTPARNPWHSQWWCAPNPAQLMQPVSSKQTEGDVHLQAGTCRRQFWTAPLVLWHSVGVGWAGLALHINTPPSTSQVCALGPGAVAILACQRKRESLCAIQWSYSMTSKIQVSHMLWDLSIQYFKGTQQMMLYSTESYMYPRNLYK